MDNLPTRKENFKGDDLPDYFAPPPSRSLSEEERKRILRGMGMLNLGDPSGKPPSVRSLYESIIWRNRNLPPKYEERRDMHLTHSPPMSLSWPWTYW
jgi:hypothetical protein